jgi:hypothetical protein
VGTKQRDTVAVDTVGGTGKATGTVKCGSKQHSQDSLEHLIWNFCTTLSDVVCLFVCLLHWANSDKFVHRNASHEMSQASGQ